MTRLDCSVVDCTYNKDDSCCKDNIHLGGKNAKVTDERGRGMLFTGDELSFSALPYTPHELENAMHAYELPEVHYTVVRVALAQMGIGGDDSWGAPVHPEYHIDVTKPLTLRFGFRGI